MGVRALLRAQRRLHDARVPGAPLLAGSAPYLTYLSIIAYVLTKISVTLFAGGIVFRTLMGVDFWTGALITVGFTGVYTVFGGLRALEAETKASRRIDLWLSIGVAALVAFVWIPFA